MNFEQISPKSTTIYISNICNSRCITCDVWRNKTPSIESKDKWFEVIDQLTNLGIKHICFSGGEPFLRSDLFELVEYAISQNIHFVEINTNALLLDKRKIAQLCNMGVRRINLSIDGIESTHDAIRGVPGGFRKNVQALENLAKKEIEVVVYTNILRQNLAELAAIIELSIDHNAFWCANIINNTQYYFRGINKEQIFPGDRELVNKLIHTLKQELDKHPLSILLKKTHLPYLKKILLNNGQVTEMPHCHTGLNCIYINADLDVFPGCNALKKIDTLKTNRIGNILTSHSYMERVKQMYHLQCPGCTCSIWTNIEHWQRKDRLAQQIEAFKKSRPDERQSFHDHTKAPYENLQYYRNLKHELQKLQVPVKEISINMEDFTNWLNRFPSLNNHYKSFGEAHIEKCLEHYLTFHYCRLVGSDILVDVGAAGSPWAETLNETGLRSYRLDLSFPKGINGTDIGADAKSTNLPEGFASCLTLHCSYECFMEDTDISFLSEAERILAPGGRLAIVPLYLDRVYFIATSPYCDQREVLFDPEAQRIWRDDTYKVPFSRHYSPKSFYTRIVTQLPDSMQGVVLYCKNLKEIMELYPDQKIYCFFMFLAHKQAAAQ